jgi:hypothetical protein
MYDDDDKNAEMMSFIVGAMVAFVLGLPIIFYVLFAR